jgi:hypothetical protein
METEILRLISQEPNVDLYPETDESNPYIHTVFLPSNQHIQLKIHMHLLLIP